MIALLFGLLAGPMQTAPVRVELSSVGETCRLSLEGKEVSQPDLTRRARRWTRQNLPVLIAADIETSYRCIGGAIYLLQRAGVTRLDAGEEPGGLVRLAVPAGACAPTVNGQRVSLEELEGLFGRWQNTKTLVDFLPSIEASDTCLASVIALWKRYRDVKMGFTGNEVTEP